MKHLKGYSKMRIPEPDFEEDSVTFYPLVRVGPYEPFGYRSDPKDKFILQPVEKELILLEQAKDHVKAGHSLRDVAAWLTAQTGRKISHQGLNTRLQSDQKREKEYINARYLARQFLQAYRIAKKIEASRLGKREPLDDEIDKELFEHVSKES